MARWSFGWAGAVCVLLALVISTSTAQTTLDDFGAEVETDLGRHHKHDDPSQPEINCDIGRDCLTQLFNASHWYHMIVASGLVLEDMGNYAACKAQDDMHMCVADFAAFAQGLCLPEQCSQENLTAIWNMISWNNATVNKYLDKCAKPQWDDYCKKTFPLPQREACEANFHLIEDAILDYWDLLEQLTGNFTGLEFHCGTHTQVGIDARAAVMILAILLPVAFVVLQTMRAYGKDWLKAIRSRSGEEDDEGVRELTPSHGSLNSIKGEAKTLLETSTSGYGSTDSNITEVAVSMSRVKAKLPRKDSVFWKVAACFDVPRNWAVLMETGGSRSIKCLDGLRTISMFWIILGHTLNFQINKFVGVSNYDRIYYDLAKPSMQLINAAPFAVDTFFFLSGLLTTYVTLRKSFRKGSKRISILPSILFRWLRILPLLAFVLGVYACLMKYFGEGPLWYRMLEELKLCDSYWWPHFLFINNFYPTEYNDQCVPWSWYLANDMQFFVVGIVLIALYRRMPAVSTFTTMMLVVTDVSLSWVLGSQHGYNPGNTVTNVLYDKPYVRVSPYAIGMLFGFFVLRYEKHFSRLHWSVCLSMVAAALATILSIMFGTLSFNWQPATPNWTEERSVAYLAFTRIGWSLALCLIVTACMAGKSFGLDWILSRGMWQPLGRLTFGAYLIHPAFIRLVYYQRVSFFYYNWSETVLHFNAFLFAAYLLAVVFFIGVEQPTANLLQVFLKK